MAVGGWGAWQGQTPGSVGCPNGGGGLILYQNAGALMEEGGICTRRVTVSHGFVDEDFSREAFVCVLRILSRFFICFLSEKSHLF